MDFGGIIVKLERAVEKMMNEIKNRRGANDFSWIKDLKLRGENLQFSPAACEFTIY